MIDRGNVPLEHLAAYAVVFLVGVLFAKAGRHPFDMLD